MSPLGETSFLTASSALNLRSRLILRRRSSSHPKWQIIEYETMLCSRGTSFASTMFSLIAQSPQNTTHCFGISCFVLGRQIATDLYSNSRCFYHFYHLRIQNLKIQMRFFNCSEHKEHAARGYTNCQQLGATARVNSEFLLLFFVGCNGGALYLISLF